MRPRRPGVILPVVLMILLLLGLLVAMFSLRVNADLASTHATALRLQTRLAAEAGIDRVKLLLRTARFDMEAWYNNPEELHRIVVWGPEADESSLGTNDDRFADADMIYRFSIVADDPTDDEELIRLGITDEASKLNINTMTESQWLTLLSATTVGREDVDPQAIVDAIMDWTDTDNTPRGEAGDTEGEYYKKLPKPYRVKNGKFDTLEELLLVKGVSGQILYGEDWDRNGLLTANEDDGDQTFPPDDQDGILNPGLHPHLTAFSAENNVSNDNRPRVSLQLPTEKLKAELALVFPDEPDVVEYIASAAKPPKPKNPKSPGGAQPPPAGGKPPKPGAGPVAPGGPNPTTPGLPKPPKSGGGNKETTQKTIGDGPQDPPGGTPTQGGKQPKSPRGNPPQGNPPTPPPSGGQEGEPPGSDDQEVVPTGEQDQQGTGDEKPGEEDEEGDEKDDKGEQQQGGDKPEPLRTPASLLKPRSTDGQAQPNPLTLEHLPVLLDRLTVRKAEEKTIKGLINVNTAPALVLSCLQDDNGEPILTDEQIQAIIQVRATLDSSAKMTPAWLVTENVLDLDTFDKIGPAITARGQQFTIESLGYADHVGMITRLHVVVDMVGPIAQTIYYRDLTYIGGHFPIREEDLETLRVR